MIKEKLLKRLEIPTWKMNELFAEEGYDLKKFKERMDLTAGFLIAEKFIKNQIEEYFKEND